MRDKLLDFIQMGEDIITSKLESCLPDRADHVRGVRRRVNSLTGLFEGDYLVLEIAALVHDIGYAPDLVRSGFHPIDGARFLEEAGFPARVCGLVAHHSCAYREAELRQLTGELSHWTDEETPLRDALWWADMTTSPVGGPMAFEDRIAEIQDRYGPEDLVTFFIRQAKPELQAAVERTERRLRDAVISYE